MVAIKRWRTIDVWRASNINDEIKCNALCVSNTLKWFAHGPRDLVMSFTEYIINDLQFHTKEAEKSRQNSGVLVEATIMCRSSARDHTQILRQVAYYGKKVNEQKKDMMWSSLLVCFLLFFNILTMISFLVLYQ
ncbi:hypothetical protein ACOSQ2_028398 [Xanthoceras sorbifolium]